MRWWGHVQFLANDKLEGRGTGSAGHRRAAEYVAASLQKLGLRPAGTSEYFQPVKFRSRTVVEERCSLALVRDGKAEPLMLGEDAYFSMRVDHPENVEAAIVFVGYGLPDDLAGLDMRGKVAMYIGGGPQNIPGPVRAHYQSAGERWAALKRAGAIGAISIQNPRGQDIPWERAKLSRFLTSLSLEDTALDDTAGQKLSVVVNPGRAEKFFAGAPYRADQLLALSSLERELPHFPLPASVRAKIAVERGKLESQNVAAVLPGSDSKLKDEYVVLTAHLDHLGLGEPIGGDRVYNGAMDNAAGVATLLEVARALRQSGRKLRRSVLFLAVTAEEKGLLGSKYFAAYPTVKPESIVANLNMDMFLPIYPLKRLTVYGVDESDLGDMVREVVRPLAIELEADPEPNRNAFIRSDQYSFIRRGVPALAFKIGYVKDSPEHALFRKWLKERYHAPSDDLHQPVDMNSAAKFNDLMVRLTEAVAYRESRPEWKPNSFFRRYKKEW